MANSVWSDLFSLGCGCPGTGGNPGPGGTPCQATVTAQITPGATISPGTWTYSGGTATTVLTAPNGGTQFNPTTFTVTGPSGGTYPLRCVTLTPSCGASITTDLRQTDLSACYLASNGCPDSGCASGPGPDNRGYVPKSLRITFRSYKLGMGFVNGSYVPVHYDLFGPNEGQPIGLTMTGITSNGYTYDSGQLGDGGEWYVTPDMAWTIDKRYIAGVSPWTPANMPPNRNGTKVPFDKLRVTVDSGNVIYTRTSANFTYQDSFSASIPFCAPFYHEGAWVVTNGYFSTIGGGRGALAAFLAANSSNEILASYVLEDGCSGSGGGSTPSPSDPGSGTVTVNNSQAPLAQMAGPPVAPDLIRAVATCPDRGGVLPLSQQAGGPDGPSGCQCGSAELSECRANRGPIPGFPRAVWTSHCLDCRRQARGTPLP